MISNNPFNNASNTTRTSSASAATNISRRSTTRAEKDNENKTINDNVRSSLRSFVSTGRHNRQPALLSDEPFHVIVINVGSTLLLICAVIYLLIMVSTSRSFSFPQEVVFKGAISYDNLRGLPSMSQKWDPFDISDQYLQPKQIPHPQDEIDFGSLLHLFLPQATLLRDEFAKRYGGRSSARAILQRGIQPVSFKVKYNSNNYASDSSSGVIYLAQRLQHAAQTKDSFRILVAGSSAAAGLGNTPTQSYPAVLEQYITSACAALGISLVIQNAAVETNSEFPWTWCLGNHVVKVEDDDKDGKHSQTSYLHPFIDLIIWDFKTSTSTLQAFEAFLRHAASINSNNSGRGLQPLFMFRISSSFTDRHVSLLQSYVQAGVLVDPILIRLDRAAEPFLALPESNRPLGFSGWLEFESSTTSNALSSKSGSLSVQQHELIAWLITMRILSALELIAADTIVIPSQHQTKLLPPLIQNDHHHSLPPPISTAASELHHAWGSLVWGVPSDDKTWTMRQTQCRTSFDSILPSNLQDLIVSGTVGGDDPSHLLRPKSAMFYNAGWVLDLDRQLRLEKRLKDGSSNDHDVDTKKAYYGVSTSGTLRMFIPIVRKEQGEHFSGDITTNKKKKNEQLPVASDYVQSLAVCEFALTRRAEGCRFPEDLAFRIDGKPTEASIIRREIAANVNNACVGLEIPFDARLSRRHDVDKKSTDKDVKSRRRKRKDMDDTSIENTLGLQLEIKVSNSRLTWDKGPCSIAQIIWQNKEVIQ